MKGISAILIIYNEEEKLLSRCINSMKNCVDQIIVVHDGPAKDNTKKFLKKFPVEFYEREHKGYMEAHLIFALKKCKYDWIFRIDADEFMSKELSKNIRKLCETKEYDHYSFFWPINHNGKDLTKYGPFKRVLFRKSAISYIESIHQNFICKGKGLSLMYKLGHHPKYNNLSLKIFNTKWVKWADIEARGYFRDFKTIEKYHYKENNWPSEIEFTIKHPIISLLFYPIYSFFLNSHKFIFTDFYVVVACFYYSLYRAVVCWKIIKIKYFRKVQQ